MGRYDSPLSIATLFLAATVVSVGLIFLFDAESERRHPDKLLAPTQAKRMEELKEEKELYSRGVNRVSISSQQTEPSADAGAPSNFFGFIHYKLTNLFKRKHIRAKRNPSSEDSEEIEDDGRIEEPYALPLTAPQQRQNLFFKREASEDPFRSPSHHDPKNNLGPSPPPPSTGFHKIRHAMKKLGGGGLDLSILERILDSNPGRFRSNSEEEKESEGQQQQQQQQQQLQQQQQQLQGQQSQQQLNHQQRQQQQQQQQGQQYQQQQQGQQYQQQQQGQQYQQQQQGQQYQQQQQGQQYQQQQQGQQYQQQQHQKQHGHEYKQQQGQQYQQYLQQQQQLQLGQHYQQHVQQVGNPSQQQKQLLQQQQSQQQQQLGQQQNVDHSRAYNSYTYGKNSQVDSNPDVFSLAAGNNIEGDNGKVAEKMVVPTTPEPGKSFEGEQEMRGSENKEKGGWRSGKQRGEKMTWDNNLSSHSSPAAGKSSKSVSAVLLNGGSAVIDPSSADSSVEETGRVEDWQSTGSDTETHSRMEGNQRRQDHSREEDLQSPTVVHNHVRPPTKEDVPICYKTDDVLIVVAITCCLNFAFVLAVWGCVRWFSISSTSKERDFQQLDCEDGGESIIFQEEQDHEDCCWRPISPEFEPDKLRREEEYVEVPGLSCRHSHHHPHLIPRKALMSDSLKNNISPPLLFIPSLLNTEDLLMGRHNIVNSLRKPHDRFHFFRQKQYQRNLKEFGLGFVGSSPRKGPQTSSSLYSFQPSNVPQPSSQSSSSSSLQKVYSHSMEDLRDIHT